MEGSVVGGSIIGGLDHRIASVIGGMGIVSVSMCHWRVARRTRKLDRSTSAGRCSLPV
jgi:hypothetical protein